MTTYPYPRTRYCFDGGIRCVKSPAAMLRVQQCWNTFEQIENYNDEIYHLFTQGYFDKPFYMFKDREELNVYREGQRLHRLRYSDLPATTFDSIHERPIPNVPMITRPPNFSQVGRDIRPAVAAISGTEKVQQDSDVSVYVYVSTFNQSHAYKYAFVSTDEQLAYQRGEQIATAT